MGCNYFWRYEGANWTLLEDIMCMYILDIGKYIVVHG